MKLDTSLETLNFSNYLVAIHDISSRRNFVLNAQKVELCFSGLNGLMFGYYIQTYMLFYHQFQNTLKISLLLKMFFNYLLFAQDQNILQSTTS